MEPERFLQILDEETASAFPSKERPHPVGEQLDRNLRSLWAWCVEGYFQRHYGFSRAAYKLMLPAFDEQRYKEELEQFRAWLEHARHVFCERVNDLAITVVARGKRKKHWLNAELTDAAVVGRTAKAKSKVSGSLFFYGVKLSTLQEWLSLLMGHRIVEFLKKEHQYYYLKLDRPIGAVAGEAVDCVCFDVDYSTREAHAYPVTEAEIDEPDRVLNLSDTGFSMKYREEVEGVPPK